MTLETEKYDPVNTHWVRVILGDVQIEPLRESLERRLEQVFAEMNSRALKEGKVILSMNQSCISTAEHQVTCITTAQVVDRKVLEQQQFRQELTRN